MASLLGRLRRLGNRIKPQHAVITFAFVTALASLVLMGFVLDNGQARAEQALKRKAELTAHTISNSVVRSFEGMVGLLGGIADTLAHSPATQNDPEAIKTLLSERRYLSPAINDLLFYDRFGHLISGSRTALAANIPLPDCLNSALAPASDGIYLAEPKPGKIPGEQVRGATLEHHLEGREWIVGDALTNADISCCSYLYYPEPFGFDRAAWPNIDAWLTRISEQPGWKHPYDLMPGNPSDRA
mgnify:CR=1 FL=1